MADNDPTTLRCLMEAMESRIAPTQAREDCGCKKAMKPARVLAPKPTI